MLKIWGIMHIYRQCLLEVIHSVAPGCCERIHCLTNENVCKCWIVNLGKLPKLSNTASTVQKGVGWERVSEDGSVYWRLNQIPVLNPCPELKLELCRVFLRLD